MKNYDVAIIGAGSAGLSARSEVAKVTDNYIVIDDGPLGTTCARVGCMPSKVLIQAANDFHRRHSFAEEGISGGESLTVDHVAVMKHVRKLRDRFVRGVFGGMEKWQDTHLVRKRASFVDRNTLLLKGNGEEERVTANKIIIGTGSKPILPQEWEPYTKYLFDTDEFFEFEDLPKRVAVIGLGVIGLELGQALHRLGVEVHGIGRSRRLAGITDPEIAEYTVKKFSQEMNLKFGGAEIVGAGESGITLRAEGQEFEVDKVFLTMGRAPVVKNIGLENLNVELDQKGIPLYDSKTMRIQDTNLFIAGDVNDERPILHEASDQGKIAGYNAVRETPENFQMRTPLAVTFSYPNIARAGESHKELTERGADFVTGQVTFEGQGRAIVKLAEKGLLNLYAERKTGKVLGAELMAPEGEHLAHLIAWMIALNQDVHQVLSLPFYHPVIEEGLRTAFRSAASKVEKKAGPLEVNRIG